MNNYLVIGAGLQGEAIAYDLINYDLNSNVLVVDSNQNSLDWLKRRILSNRLQTVLGNAGDRINMDMLMSEMDVAIGAATYELNEMLTEIAINTGTHFCDLGGNNTVVEKQFAMHEEATNAKIMIMPDCGIAPGAVSIIAAKGIEIIGNPKYVHIRVGGLPQHPQGALKYMKTFSIQGLINEYIERVEILEEYQTKTVPPLGGIEKIIFKDNRLEDGQIELEAAYTSGGSSTLAKTYEGIIQTLDYKTLRYPGHWEIINARNNAGEFREDEFINGKSRRQISEELLEKEIGYKDKDVMFIQVTVGNDEKEAQFQMIDFYDEKIGHSAMQRTTGYSAAIIAEMMAYNIIKDKGILSIEKSVHPDIFFAEWKKRKLNLEYKLIHKC